MQSQDTPYPPRHGTTIGETLINMTRQIILQYLLTVYGFGAPQLPTLKVC
jgi:hypothetical protein